MTDNNKYSIKCDTCGRFCIPHDSGTYFGGVLDEDPPDPVFFCKKCSRIEAQKPKINCWWIPPKFMKVNK